ncbi:hypothetical protein TREMEDRAFT_27179 [Tremella mesenterica DSM 1558]|uniref:uncharacterized protein n=1 Tax=Tremella mesenterica (strain ATCC 24925 / CBS 8224 / DSM 1558 / NBRC 9311 / NRRL Y-6157 / RJB 2259-6 / UBC 559-6) TaxID=578456 RepID=UPI0003F4A5C4|nr:uncharacterized protein TREMEDRAFT_27179 [Tremella mesenterica DSM 1558]EIW71657.1 hypothetical protein TREMEDRAFT_27179 [Tremella mesenterica DSM 1558]
MDASSADIQTTIAPYTQKPYCTRLLVTPQELDGVISEAIKAQKVWHKVSLDERIAIAERWLVTRHLIKIAKKCLEPIPQTDTDTEVHKRTILKQPLGVIAVITPWNYPHLCTVNSVLPAILSGNAVIIKPAPQTPVPAERVLSTMLSAGLPPNVLQVVHLSQETTLKYLCTDPRVELVAFTGSVAGGRAVQQAAAGGKGFKAVNLELGGKDPAYVRHDVDVAWTAEQLVDGAMFNSGQSCCAVERIYVHSSVYQEFVDKFVEVAKGYKVGDPLDPETTLGPVVSLAAAERIRKQVKDAVAAGAQLVLDESHFSAAKEGTTLVGPQVLINVDHSMEIMMEETFGPVVGIMKVESDEEALGLMNDSPYGLTASIWTSPTDPTSLSAFQQLSEELECGTVYLNRCDALDPALPWSGWKDSGRGISLSTFGYDHVTRTKAIMMRVKL